MVVMCQLRLSSLSWDKFEGEVKRGNKVKKKDSSGVKKKA